MLAQLTWVRPTLTPSTSHVPGTGDVNIRYDPSARANDIGLIQYLNDQCFQSSRDSTVHKARNMGTMTKDKTIMQGIGNAIENNAKILRKIEGAARPCASSGSAIFSLGNSIRGNADLLITDKEAILLIANRVTILLIANRVTMYAGTVRVD